jgi:hypothetical protein
MEVSERDIKLIESLQIMADAASKQGLSMSGLAEKVAAAGMWEELYPFFEEMLSTNITMLHSLKAAMALLHSSNKPPMSKDLH